MSLKDLLAGRTDRVFDAYVNIGSLRPHVRVLTQRYPRAKFIVIDDVAETVDSTVTDCWTPWKGPTWFVCMAKTPALGVRFAST